MTEVGRPRALWMGSQCPRKTTQPLLSLRVLILDSVAQERDVSQGEKGSLITGLKMI